MRRSLSIIGCGRPTVNSSSPRSTALCPWLWVESGSWLACSQRGIGIDRLVQQVAARSPALRSTASRRRTSRAGSAAPGFRRCAACCRASRLSSCCEQVCLDRQFGPARRAASRAASSSVLRRDRRLAGIPADSQASAAQEADHGRLVAWQRPARRIFCATAAAGGLLTSTITCVAGSSCSAFKPASIMIPPTSSFRSRPPVPMPWVMPTPWLRQQGADFLQTGAGCRDDAHRPGWEHVGKAQRDPVEDGRARRRVPSAAGRARRRICLRAISSSSETLSLNSSTCKPALQRLPGFVGGIAPGHRDDGHVGAGLDLTARCAWSWGGTRRSPLRGFASCKQLLRLCQGGVQARLPRALTAITRSFGRGGLRLSGQQPGLAQDALVGLGRHHHGGILHAWQTAPARGPPASG